MFHSVRLTQLLQRRALLTWASGAVGLFLFGGCLGATAPATTLVPSAPPSPTPSAAADKVVPPLRVAFTSAPKQFDPARMTTVEAFQLALSVYDGLVWVDPKLTPQPMLALSWQPAVDRLSWTFQLRKGVKFHHGTVFTAQDVVYTFTRLLDPKNGSAFRSVLRFLDRVEAVGDNAVRFYLHTPNAELPFLLGAAQTRIVPHDYNSTALATKPSGTGPFQFVEFVPGERIKMVSNPNYWEANRLAVPVLEFVYINSFEAQVAALVAGKIDLVPDITLQALTDLAGNPAIAVVEVPSGRYQTIVMQATEPPFTDLRVRQALKYCVDRPALQQAILQRHGELGNDQPVAPVSPFWADLPMRGRDIAKARQLLAAAGYPKGLKLSLITSSSRPGMVELATAFRDLAQPAGVEITVVRTPPDVYWTDYNGKVPFHIGNWNFRPSIDETLMIAYHSQAQQNESRWHNAKFDTLIETARGELDLAKRKMLYQQAQTLLIEEGAVIIPYFRPVLMAMRKTLQGFTPHPAGWLDFRDVQLKQPA